MDIGSRLKEAREARRMSLNDVQKETKIQTRYLQAIEEGNFSIMPGKFYTRAFIRQYAEAVGLDAEQLMEEHKSELPSSSDEEYIQYTRLQKHKDEASNKNSAFFTLLPKLIIFLLVVGIIAVAWVFYQSTINPDDSKQPADDDNVSDEVFRPGEENADENPSGEDNEDPKDNESDQQEQQEDNKQEETEPEPTQELELVEVGSGKSPESTYTLTNVDEVKVKFEVTGENGFSYLQVQNGKGKSFFNQNNNTLNNEVSPLEIDLTGEERIWFNIGRATDVNVFINGEPFEFPINPKEKIHQKIWINIKNSVE